MLTYVIRPSEKYKRNGPNSSIPHCRQKLGLMLGNQGIGNFFQIAVHHKIQFVQGKVDAMVGHTALWVVVGADAFAAVAAADQGFALGGFFGLGFAFLCIV